LFRSELIGQGCRFNVKYELYEDWDFLIQAAIKGGFKHVDKVTGVYRTFDTSGVHSDPHILAKYRNRIYQKWRKYFEKQDYRKILFELERSEIKTSQSPGDNQLKMHQKILSDKDHEIKVIRNQNKRLIKKIRDQEIILDELKINHKKLKQLRRKNQDAIDGNHRGRNRPFYSSLIQSFKRQLKRFNKN